MVKSNFRIIYSGDESILNKVHWLWESEALAMQAVGISVGIVPDTKSKELMYRGFGRNVIEYYKKDARFINTYRHYINYLCMSYYLPYISDISIETFFTDELDERVIENISKLGWKKAFIKSDMKSLEFIEVGKSIWPETKIEEMRKLFDQYLLKGKYAIRKFIDKKIIDQEDRYWVLNGNIYHRQNRVPGVVIEAAKRLNKLGSRYYTIDATPEFVVEVNPGETSDRYAVNSAELFASWIKKEFAS